LVGHSKAGTVPALGNLVRYLSDATMKDLLEKMRNCIHQLAYWNMRSEIEGELPEATNPNFDAKDPKDWQELKDSETSSATTYFQQLDVMLDKVLTKNQLKSYLDDYESASNSSRSWGALEGSEATIDELPDVVAFVINHALAQLNWSVLADEIRDRVAVVNNGSRGYEFRVEPSSW
jgi:hypothetical protein